MKIHKKFKQNLKQRIALLLVALLALAGWPGVGLAMLPITQAMITEKQLLDASGKQSNAVLDHTVIDLVYSDSGSVTTYIYSGDAENLTVNNFLVSPNTAMEASNKITSFVFELTNQYHPDTDISISNLSNELTVNTYTYGTMKGESMWAIVNGLPDCLNNQPITGGSSNSDNSWVDQYSPAQIATTIATATFSVNSTTLMVSNSSTSEPKAMVMDVAPELKSGRTFVPVRYLAYALGVDETGVTWDDKTNTASITKDKTAIKMKIGSRFLSVNGKSDVIDVAPYIKDGRTMLPARFVAEPLGAKVGWDEKAQQVTLEIPTGSQ